VFTGLADRLRFLRSFIANPRQVGAVLPTSRRAVRDMLDLAEVQQARLVVELGAGTGVYTAALLDRLGPDAELIAFEINAGLAAGLQSKLPDRRLRVVAGSAEDVQEVLAGRRPQVVVSALPFTSLPSGTGRLILERTANVLAPGGVLLVLQYSPLLTRELSRLFGSLTRRVSLLNVPPAFLFACRDPRSTAAAGSRAAG
jgi:phospholipid N-methyltransferase